MTDDPVAEQPTPILDLSNWWNLIGEVQRLGFETARGVADRFGEMAGGAFADRVRAPRLDSIVEAWQSLIERSGDPQTQAKMVATAETMTKAAIDFCQVVWDAVVTAVPEPGPTGAGSSQDPSGKSGVFIGSTSPGQTVEGDVFVHIAAGTNAEVVVLRAGSLHAGPGESIEDSAIRLEPAQIDGPKPGESYRVKVAIDVPPDASSGTYHGLLFTLTEPDSVVNLRLEVADA